MADQKGQIVDENRRRISSTHSHLFRFFFLKLYDKLPQFVKSADIIVQFEKKTGTNGNASTKCVDGFRRRFDPFGPP